MKKVISILLIFIFLISSMTFTAFASTEIIITTSDIRCVKSGRWTESTNANVKGPLGGTSWYTSSKEAIATYDASALAEGNYGVYLYHTPYSSKSAEMIDVIINSSGMKTTITFDADEKMGQRRWIYLGNYYFCGGAGDSVVQKINENSTFEYVQRTSGVKFVKDDTNTAFSDFIYNETIIIPSQDATIKTTPFSSLTGSWSGISTNPSVLGPTGKYSWYTGSKTAAAKYKAALSSNGNYGVYIYMTPFAASTANKMDVTVTASGVSKTIEIDGLHGGEEYRHWYYLGKYDFNGNANDGVVQKVGVNTTIGTTMRTSGVMFIKNDTNINRIGNIPPAENITLIEAEPFYLDTENSGFAKFGKWNTSSVPSLMSAPSYNGSSVGAYAVWMINPGKISNVEISVPRIRTDSKEDNATVFEIYHNGELYTESVDFTLGEIGWHSLGKFDFAGDGTEYIKLIKRGSGTTRIINVKLVINEKIVEKSSESMLVGTDLHIFERMGMFIPETITDTYLDKKITRADMAVMLTRLFGKVSDIVSENNKDNYLDIPSDFWAAKTISYLKAHPEFGIKGHGKNTFSPSSYASKTELVKFILHQLGYYEITDYASKDAYKKATSLGIEVSGAEKLTPRAMAKIILSAFDVPTKNNSKRTLFEKIVRENSGISDASLLNTDRKAMSEALEKEREINKNKKRGLIYNNDGNDIYGGYSEYPKDYPVDKYVKDKEATITKENFLNGRTTGVENTTIDSIFYCTGVFNSYHHETSGETDIRKRDWSYLLKSYTGKDTLQTMSDYCKENDLEFFWSMRMNDTHDHQYREDQLDSWKKANLDKLVARKDNSLFMQYGNFRWSSVDYTHTESRQKVYDILKDVVNRYDIDGLELDFTRFPIYFKEVTEGIDVYPENIERMNDLMRMIRTMTEIVSAEKNKPILLSIYVPDSIKYCKALGLDIKTWLDEKLVDIVVVGELNRFQTWAESVNEYSMYDVPVYAGLDDLAFKKYTIDGVEKSHDLEKEAAIAWNEGVDGVYIYNLWYNPRKADENEVFYIIGDSKKVSFDENYKTFFKGADTVSRGYVKNTKSYVTDAFIASKPSVEE